MNQTSLLHYENMNIFNQNNNENNVNAIKSNEQNDIIEQFNTSIKNIDNSLIIKKCNDEKIMFELKNTSLMYDEQTKHYVFNINDVSLFEYDVLKHKNVDVQLQIKNICYVKNMFDVSNNIDVKKFKSQFTHVFWYYAKHNSMTLTIK